MLVLAKSQIEIASMMPSVNIFDNCPTKIQISKEKPKNFILFFRHKMPDLCKSKCTSYHMTWDN